jgi:hypothetical protein
MAIAQYFSQITSVHGLYIYRLHKLSGRDMSNKMSKNRPWTLKLPNTLKRIKKRHNSLKASIESKFQGVMRTIMSNYVQFWKK